jgi:hypothetical protein
MCKLVKILYSKYLFLWSGQVQFLTTNSRVDFSQIEGLTWDTIFIIFRIIMFIILLS